MPIYKVSVDSSRSGPQVLVSTDARDSGAAQGEARGGDGGMSFMEKTEADRQLDGVGFDWKTQRVLGTNAQLGLGPESAASGGRAGSNLVRGACRKPII